MSEAKRWAVGLLAIRMRGNVVDTHHDVITVDEASKYGAEGLGMAILRKLFPGEDGWRDHHATARDCADGPFTLEGAMLHRPAPAGSPPPG
jgi:hypothetical protein